jgi:hypothetical protein
MFKRGAIPKSELDDLSPYCRFISAAAERKAIDIFCADGCDVMRARTQACGELICRTEEATSTIVQSGDKLRCAIYAISDGERSFLIHRIVNEIHWIAKALFWDERVAFGKFASLSRAERVNDKAFAPQFSLFVIRAYSEGRDTKFVDGRLALTANEGDTAKRLRAELVGAKEQRDFCAAGALFEQELAAFAQQIRKRAEKL